MIIMDTEFNKYYMKVQDNHKKTRKISRDILHQSSYLISQL